MRNAESVWAKGKSTINSCLAYAIYEKEIESLKYSPPLSR